MKLSDRLWLWEMKLNRFVGRLQCKLSGKHRYSRLYPKSFCSRCGTFPAEKRVEWTPPDWFGKE
jgi:hypothetical protein